MTQSYHPGPYPPGAPLPYLTPGALGPLPLTPENAHVLNEAAEYAAGAKNLRINGITDIVLGGLFLVLGLATFGAVGVAGTSAGISIWFSAAYAALGAILLAAGIWTCLSPGPAAMLVDGVVLFLLFGFNLVLNARDYQAGQRPGAFSVVILIILFSAGINRFRNVKKFKQAAQTPLSPATLQWLQQLQKDLARAKSATDPTLVTFTATGGWPPVAFRGRLLEGLAVCVINNKLRFLTRAQLRADHDAAPSSGMLTKVKMTLDGRELNAQVPTTELPRLLSWLSMPDPAPPAPIFAPPMSPSSPPPPGQPMYSPLMPPPPPPFT